MRMFVFLCVLTVQSVWGAITFAANAERPNIVWIVGEDASPHIGCYGEKTIRTPFLDQMAADGVRFTSAFVTCPVCSPSRSAMVTGMYQTTLGAHNHRSQNLGGKANGNTAYYDNYRLPSEVPLVPQLFRDGGYYTTLGAGPKCNKPGKTDYNFIYDKGVYDGADWRKCPGGKPFFAQIMLHGGKNRGAREHKTDPSKVELPPYYPDHPVLRRDWADYLNSWVQMDREVGEILHALDEENVADDTVVFFWTDHGISHMRDKQFLYDGGIRVPLIVRFGDGRLRGTTRDDLVVHIDVAAASLALAGITIPDHVQGRDLFAEDGTPREIIFSARDRCDETVDTIRCARTGRYKYIRNFLSYRPHAQANQYKDGKAIVQTMRKLNASGDLNELQARVFAPTRPTEELYDLENDPYETVNLADDPAHQETVQQLRGELYGWMETSRDVGLIPEPILEELGRKYGSKYHVLDQPENEGLIREIIATIEAGERGDGDDLRSALASERPTVRYWAAVWLGNLGEKAAIEGLTSHLDDPSPTVRVAAAMSLYQLGQTGRLKQLADDIDADNLIVGMYAIRAIERTGADLSGIEEAIKGATESPYDSTRRIARRLAAQLGE